MQNKCTNIDLTNGIDRYVCITKSIMGHLGEDRDGVGDPIIAWIDFPQTQEKQLQA